MSLLGCPQLRNLFVTKSFEENPNFHIDNEYDCDFNHRTVGRRFRVDYHNGWFTGYVTWYNSTMKTMRFAYEDGTDDYFAASLMEWR